jgi:membrane protease subunit HflK
MAANNGGPWGGGGGNRGGSGNGGDDRNSGNNGGNRRPPENQIPELDDLVNKGREQFRVLMGGGNGGGRGPANGGGDGGPGFSNGLVLTAAAGVAVLFWGFNSIYTVKPEERSVELLLGSYWQTGEPGLNFAPWPFVTHEVLAVTTERTIEIGTSRSGRDAGLMLTGDENIVDIDFQVVWNIAEPDNYLFNLADAPATIEAVAESAMREIIAQSELAPILNRDRGVIAQRLEELIQDTLDSYDSGVSIVRINFDKADPPEQVLAAFRAVQDAEQERERLQNEADRDANQKLAAARGEAAQTLEQAEAYRAQVVNQAQGEASRFTAVLGEYQNAPDVTRQRIYLETMESVLGDIDIMLLDDGAGGDSGVVPYLPLNELIRNNQSGGSN